MLVRCLRSRLCAVGVVGEFAMNPTYTPEVLAAVAVLRKLTTGELVAVNQILEREWQLPDPPPEAGVREPLPHRPSSGGAEAVADE